MFCDVVGSTELAARLGAETWSEVVGAYQAFGGKCVERYEGYLAQVLGDGLLVYFGYPQAHEDDAERAVRCALEIRDGLPALNQRLEAESGVRLAVRMGVRSVLRGLRSSAHDGGAATPRAGGRRSMTPGEFSKPTDGA